MDKDNRKHLVDVNRYGLTWRQPLRIDIHIGLSKHLSAVPAVKNI